MGLARAVRTGDLVPDAIGPCETARVAARTRCTPAERRDPARSLWIRPTTVPIVRAMDQSTMRTTPLENFPPPERWDDWEELDAKAWPRRG